ncbi:NAD(P)H-dependent oxidoreductase [Entomospira entomophila]|uniref:NAD(P)H-dependent oxidoreductase n=1 Tax=Entomospira entomophila TaxID=2719988 RepID=A0A968GC88_9SPIO|nr:NAD(P)H-dependent oxidoreductase [Entomospira entomophilus]NIZ40958.1 NAD(P)H-dependent oxidoreductase [Entomospira entomophilus]WDI35171.1 NAD(P)H-dependent oxidoreductase [Entomospira entomophilus]
MQRLVISGHPHIENSFINRTWIEQIREQYPEIEIHELCKHHAQGVFSIEEERERLKRADSIIFIYPIYWYAAPWLLQKWMEDVITYDFYHTELALQGKFFQVAVSLGGADTYYQLGGVNSYPLDIFLMQMQAFATKCWMHYHSHYAFFAAHSNDAQARMATDRDDFLSWVMMKQHG